MGKKQIDLDQEDGVERPTLASKGDIARILHETNTHAGGMTGFDAEFKDIVDYIIKITHRIWEEKAIGDIYRYYLHNAIIHTNSADIYGREQVVVGTIQSLAAFPDRRLYGDDVIWMRQDDETYFSSHRITHEGSNLGHTIYGDPTGRKVRYRAIADCIMRENRIVEEWLVRDELLLITQLGFDPHLLARQFAEMESLGANRSGALGEVNRLRGQLPPRDIEPSDPAENLEAWLHNLFHEIWNWRMLNRVDAYFDERILAESASGRSLHGWGDYKAYILSLLAPLPDLAIQVQHCCVMADGENTFRAATRWEMQGTHTGPGIYGKPTGKRINVFGISHHLIQNGKIVREWTLFDEFAVLKQLYAPG